MRSLLIVGGRSLDPEVPEHRPEPRDILIEDGVIAAFGEKAARRARATGAVVYDAGNRLITPGFVNAHSHSHDSWLRGMFEQMPLEVWGLHAFPTQWRRRSIGEIRIRTLLHATECLRNGITTIQDMVTIGGDDRDEALAICGTYESAGARAVVTPQFSDRAIVDGIPFAEDCFPAVLRAQLPGPRAVADIAGFLIPLFAETMPARVKWGLGPVQPQICSDELLRFVSRLADENGLRVYTHLYETRTEAVLARRSLPADGGSIVARLARLGLLDERLNIGHGVWITAEEIARCGAAGVHLACNAVTNLKLLNGLPPVRAYADARVNIGLGCDNTSANDAQDMFQAMKLFALAWGMQSAAGDDGAAAAAFKAATVGGAKALGMEGQVGRIAVGYRADLVLFDLADPNWRPLNSALRQLVYGSPARSITAVLVDGELVVENDRAVFVDEVVLNAEVEDIRASLADEAIALERSNGAMVQAYLKVFERAGETAVLCEVGA